MRNPDAGKPDGPSPGTKYLGVGLTWIGSTVLFLLLGAAADRRFGTKPWLTLVGMVIGIGAGFYSLLRQIAEGSKAGPPRNAKTKHEE